MTRQRSVAGLVMPLFMIAFAAVYWHANRHVPDQDMRMVTPLIFALAGLSFLQVVRWITHRDHDGGAPLTGTSLRKPLSLIAASVILLLGAGRDFPIATALFLALALPLLGMRRPVVVAGMALLFPLALYWGFVSLGVPLNSFWLEI